jgi:predicted DNA binding CopG/RHH family protein
MSDKKGKKQVPSFRSNREEAEFWRHNDSADFELGDEVQVEVAPDARTKAISIRLPERLLQDLKREAEGQGMAYQRLIRMTLEARQQERHSSTAAEKTVPYGAAGDRRGIVERQRERMMKAGATGAKAA